MQAAAPNLSPVVVALLRGVLYREQSPQLWRDLEALQGPARDYLSVLALDLVIDEAEGYAYLRQRPGEDDEAEGPSRLIPRRALSFPVSLLCVLLRKRLLEQDAQSGEARLILHRDAIAELLRTFLPPGANEAKLDDRIDRHIRDVEELGFLRRLKDDPQHYEVRRILRALVDAEWLANYEQRLAGYREHAANT